MSDSSVPSNTAPPSAAPGSGPAKPYDPMDPFRAWRDTYLNAMAKNMSEMVNTEAYAQASGAVLDNYLTVAAPVKDALDKSMLQALEQLSLPSRQDLISLAERFTNMEMRLDDLDAKLDGLIKSVRALAPSQAAAAVPQATPDGSHLDTQE